MVTGFPGAQSHAEQLAESRAYGARPEFTALLEQLRNRAAGPSDAFGSRAFDSNGLEGRGFETNGFETQWHDDASALEPLAAEAAWAVVEQVEARADARAHAVVDELPTPAPPSAPAIPMPRRGQSTDGARLAADRAALRQLGVPPAWVRRLHGGDRYADIWQALEPLPEVDIDPQTPVVAVVGPAESVRLEAHRVAIDLAVSDVPRRVVEVPAVAGAQRAAALHDAGRLAACVVAIEAGPDGDPALVVESMTSIGPGVVIVIVEAGADLGSTQARLDALGSIDAIAVEGLGEAAAPMQLLQLGVPITRLDGVPIDRMTWTALLCAQLEAAAPAT
jgi:hypothetical protein